METRDFSDIPLSEKEQKILEAAVKVFSEKGFSASTTSEIAKNAGMAEGTIFRYFKTKKDILRGIMIQALQLVRGNIIMGPVEKILLTDQEKDLRTILRELMYDRMKLIEKFFPMARVLLTESLFHEDVREAIYKNIIIKMFDTFMIFHKNMVQRGYLRDDLDAEAILRSIIGNIFLFIAQRQLYGDKFKSGDVDKEFDKMLDVLMLGIAKPQGPVSGK